MNQSTESSYLRTQRNIFYPCNISSLESRILGRQGENLRKGRRTADTDGMLYKLLAAGIPEEAIFGNRELFDFVTRAEKNEALSKNQSFYLTDKEGKRWLVKFTDNKAKAEMEAAANYHLSQHLRFIVPGKCPKPAEANGLYMTMQKDVSGELEIARPVEYWLSALALFHRDAERILRENHFDIRPAQLKTPEHLRETYSKTRKRQDIPFDEKRISESFQYLQQTQHRVLIHGDARIDNLYRGYLIDLETCTTGHPAIDISMILMQFAIPKQSWDRYLEQYIRIRGIKTTLDQELKELKEGIGFATFYTATKEITGSSTRNTPERTRKNNQLLNAYLIGAI